MYVGIQGKLLPWITNIMGCVVPNWFGTQKIIVNFSVLCSTWVGRILDVLRFYCSPLYRYIYIFLLNLHVVLCMGNREELDFQFFFHFCFRSQFVCLYDNGIALACVFWCVISQGSFTGNCKKNVDLELKIRKYIYIMPIFRFNTNYSTAQNTCHLREQYGIYWQYLIIPTTWATHAVKG